MPDYACLQIAGGEPAAAGQEWMIEAITAYMDAQGLRPCGREEAERTVCFAPTPKGWAVFDDAAGRLDLCAFHGLGRALTAGTPGWGIGIMSAGEGLLLSLYAAGRVQDTYITSPKALGDGGCMPRWFGGHGRAFRWREQIGEGYSVADLARLFERGRREGRAVLPEIRQILELDRTAGFGFSSLEEAALPDLVTLYFYPSNTIKQSLWERFWHPARRAAAGLGVLFHRPRCSGDRE